MRTVSNSLILMEQALSHGRMFGEFGMESPKGMERQLGKRKTLLFSTNIL